MTKRALVCTALAMLGVLVLAACGSGDQTGSSGGGIAPTKSEVAVGWVGQISGTQPCVECGDILEAWAKEVNHNGGLAGHSVKVIVKDDAGDPAKSLAAVKDLVENQKVVALIAPKVTGQEAAWSTYVEQHNVPVIGGAGYTDVWSKSPAFFSSASGVAAQVYSQVYATKFGGASSYGVLYCQESPNCKEAVPHYTELASGLGVEQRVAAAVSGSAAGYTAQCVQMKQAGVGAVLLALAGQTSIRVAADCARQNFKTVYVVPTGAILGQMATSPGLDGAIAPMSTFGWWQTSTPAQQEFATLAKGITGTDPDTMGATITFTGAKLFQKVFTAAATSDQVTSAQLIDQLYQVKDETLDGLTPPLTFTKGQPKAAPCFFLSKITGGKFVTQNNGTAVCLPATP